MISLKELLSEVPVDTFQTVGDFEKGASFQDKRDRALLTNPITPVKVRDFFKNTSSDFDFYFVNLKGRRKFAERGKVDESVIYAPYPDGLGIKRETLAGGGINENNITVFFVGNSAAEKVPMTSWTIAHRFGHAIRFEYGFKEYVKWLESQFNEILKMYNVGINPRYDRYGYRIDTNVDSAKAKLFNQVGTMRSARQGGIDRYAEFYYELFAQYLKDGKVTLNRLKNTIKTGTGPYGRAETAYTKQVEVVNDILEGIERDFYFYAEDALNGCVGNVYIM